MVAQPLGTRHMGRHSHPSGANSIDNASHAPDNAGGR